VRRGQKPERADQETVGEGDTHCSRQATLEHHGTRDVAKGQRIFSLLIQRMLFIFSGSSVAIGVIMSESSKGLKW